jgi:rhodanese-related sulfurtransferase
MANFRSYLERIKSEIKEIDVPTTVERMKAGAVIIDVREPNETADGHVEGAHLFPRGVLESRIEDNVPERGADVILYCASGNRSALAAHTLKEIGYTNVTSMAGGFQAWKQAGLAFDVPKTFTAEQMSRYSRHMIIPEVGERGQRKLLDAKVLMLGAGGLGSPAAYYLAAAGVGTIGIIDDDVVDRSNLQRQIIHNDSRVGMSKAEGQHLQHPPERGQRDGHLPRVRHRRRWRRQLPHPLPGERRMCSLEHPERHRIGLPI